MNYIEMAKHAGYDGDAETLTSVGMAIELAYVAWSWFEHGNDRHNVAAIFAYRDEEPNEKDTVGAYAEGAYNEARKKQSGPRLEG